MSAEAVTSRVDLERQQFRAALEGRLSPNWSPPFQLRFAYGISNGPFLLDGGFRFGMFKLDLKPERFDELADAGGGLMLLTSLQLPPVTVLNLALVFEGEALERFGDRIEAIRRELALDDGAERKLEKLRVYLMPDGLRVTHAKDPLVLSPDDSTLGPALPVGLGYHGDVAAGALLTPISHIWLGHLGALLGTAEGFVPVSSLPLVAPVSAG